MYVYLYIYIYIYIILVKSSYGRARRQAEALFALYTILDCYAILYYTINKSNKKNKETYK